VARRGNRLLAWLALAAIACGRAGAVRVPDVPDVSRSTPAIQKHLRERHDAAAAAPASSAEQGAYCIALHADMFFDDAERCYEVVSQRDATDWRWLYLSALIRADRGDAAAVKRGMQAVVNLDPQFAPAWWQLGEADFKLGDYEGAASAWQRVTVLPEPDRQGDSPVHVAEVPIAAYALFGLVRIAEARGDRRPSSQAALEQVTTSAPRFGSAFRLLADIYAAGGRQADADRARAKADRLPAYAPYADPLVDVLSRDSRNSTYLLRQASDAELSVNAGWSEYLTRRALEFDPDNPDVISKMARLMRALGRRDEALVYFTRYHEVVPADFRGLTQIGTALLDLGRFDEAERSFRRALAENDDSLARYNLGLVFARTGRAEQAAAEYERALALDPYAVDPRINLAVLLVRQDKLERAEHELAEALRVEPGNATAHANMGVVLARRGRIDRAVAEFQEALRLDPSQPQAAAALEALRKAKS